MKIQSNIQKYFVDGSLTYPQSDVAEGFYDLARNLMDSHLIKDRQELEEALRKLLEAKDCAVRATR